jgi:hypothetical protein
MEKLVISFVTEMRKKIYCQKKHQTMEMLSLKTLDLEARLHGNILDTLKINNKTKRKFAKEFLIIGDNHKIIFVMETIKMIYMPKN